MRKIDVFRFKIYSCPCRKKTNIRYVPVVSIILLHPILSLERAQQIDLTAMWNVLFKQAYDDNNNYFFQCGDDINFHTKNWITDSIAILKSNNDIGISGPVNNNFRILASGQGGDEIYSNMQNYHFGNPNPKRFPACLIFFLKHTQYSHVP